LNLNWYQSILYGLVSGLTEVFPVSSQAHRFLMQKLFGVTGEPGLMRLLIDLGILAALYYACQNHIIRIIRARRLARVPKRRRKRPLDTRSLMDFSMLRTMLIPVILVICFYGKIRTFQVGMIWIAAALLVNGFILYIPQFFPSGNRDSRNSSRVHALLTGLGGAASFVPGISGIGTATSVGSLCGIDRVYCLNMTLLMNMAVYIGMILFDVIGIVTNGIDSVGFSGLITYFLTAVAAFGSATGAIKVMRYFASEIGYTLFAYYCWGVALFTFIMNLMV